MQEDMVMTSMSVVRRNRTKSFVGRQALLQNNSNTYLRNEELCSMEQKLPTTPSINASAHTGERLEYQVPDPPDLRLSAKAKEESSTPVVEDKDSPVTSVSVNGTTESLKPTASSKQKRPSFLQKSASEAKLHVARSPRHAKTSLNKATSARFNCKSTKSRTNLKTSVSTFKKDQLVLTEQIAKMSIVDAPCIYTKTMTQSKKESMYSRTDNANLYDIINSSHKKVPSAVAIQRDSNKDLNNPSNKAHQKHTEKTCDTDTSTTIEILLARNGKSKWARLRNMFTMGESGEEYIRINSSSHGVLFTLLSQAPPVDIVEKFLDIFPTSVEERDEQGRTPLHAACMTPCEDSLEIIELLLFLFKEAAHITDSQGRTPLMLACSHGKSMDQRVMKLLIKATQHIVTAEDEDGMSALEYALLSEVNYKVFQKLQIAHAYQMRKQSARAA